MSFDPETLSLVAAGAIGIVGLFFFSSTSSSGGDDPNANQKNSPGTVLPPGFLGLGSGTSATTAKEHGYDVDPTTDPADSGLCNDLFGIYDPNKSVVEKVFEGIPLVGWVAGAGSGIGKGLACSAIAQQEIPEDTAAASAAYAAGNYTLAYNMIRQVVETQSVVFGREESYWQRASDPRGPDADKSLDPKLATMLRLYTSAYYTYVVCKAQLDERRNTYKMACESYNDNDVPPQRVVDLLSKIFASTASMQEGAVTYYIAFFDPDSDIAANTATMYATVNTGLRGNVHYDASQNTTATAMPDDSAPVNTVTGGFVTPTRRVTSQPTDEQMIRALVLASVADFPALSKSYRDSMSMLKFNTLYAKMLPLRDAYGRYMNGVQVYKAWQASAAEATDDVRAAVADGAAAYKQLPPYIVTDTVGIASALHVIDEDTRYRHPKLDTSLPGGQKVVGAAGRYYSGADCNYGGCQ